MARKPRVQRLIRLPAAVNEWLKDRAVGNDQNVTAELTNILKNMMEADPLRIVVHHGDFEGGEFFTVSVGEFGDHLYEGQSKDDSMTAALAKAKELGLPRSSVVIVEARVQAEEAA
jgi:hypothetical protein